MLITGANRGIGFEFAKQLAAGGWDVIATARNPAAAEALQALAENDNVSIEQLDVTSKEDIAALAAKYRDQPVDLLLLNAAKGPTQPTAMLPVKKQDFDVSATYFEVNATGPMRVSQAFWENVRGIGA